MSSEPESEDIVELAQRALQANREHQHALEAHTQKLEAELERFDKLLEAVETIDESDLDLGCFVTIPGSVKATAPIATKELLSPESPFHEEALKRSRYQNASEVHPMKTKELETLTEAVNAERYRKHALGIQQSEGSLSLSDIDAQTAHALGLNDVDWVRIAEKVSTVSVVARSARECEVRWLGEQHPEFNHEPWTQEEVLKVKSLAADFTDRQPDWVTVAQRLGTHRTPLDCMRQAILRKTHRWTLEADERLLKAICMYGHENWHLVARYVSEDATPSQCSNRFQKTLDKSIKHSSWTPEEDARLTAAVAAYGSSWVDVAAYVPGRHNDQCRDRWTDQLDPSTNRCQWSTEEDKVLVDCVHKHKDASWKQIAEHLCNGRTEAMCRNRYAALQRGASSAPTTPAVNSDVQHVSVDQRTELINFTPQSLTTLCFKSLQPVSHTGPAPPETEHNYYNQLVFLEPVVSSNPELHNYRKPRTSQHKSRFKGAMTGDVPRSKKRKTRSHTPRSMQSSTATQHGESTDRDSPLARSRTIGGSF